MLSQRMNRARLWRILGDWFGVEYAAWIGWVHIMSSFNQIDVRSRHVKKVNPTSHLKRNEQQAQPVAPAPFHSTVLFENVA